MMIPYTIWFHAAAPGSHPPGVLKTLKTVALLLCPEYALQSDNIMVGLPAG